MNNLTEMFTEHTRLNKNLLLTVKIDCKKIKSDIHSLIHNKQVSSTSISPTFLDLSKQQKLKINNYAAKDNANLDNIALGIRTYICTSGLCNLHYNRSHRRMSKYNWNKIENTNNIIKIAKIIINTWTLNEEKNKKMQALEVNCDYNCKTRPKNIQHIHFVKESTDLTKTGNECEYIPIESVFSEIDMMAESNNVRGKLNVVAAPGKQLQQLNSYRMHYGDINYLGSNKAIFYFDRGIKGKQIFTNSMYPLKQQPAYKDLVVIDEIVFTSSCKCDSPKQHKEMFPHYRTTCAKGLTCPARLNSYEKIIYARDRNATTEMFTTARAMLIKYW